MGAFDDLIPAATPSGGAFDDLIPSPTPSGTPEDGGNGLLAKVNAALRKPSPEVLQAPEAAVRELVQGMVPHDVPSYLASLYPPAAVAKQAMDIGEGLAQGDVSGVPLIGRIPEIMQADETPAGSKERYLTAMKTLMDLGMLAGGGEGVRETPPTEAPPPVQPPPIPPQYAERRFTMQDTPPEQPPQLAPAPPIEQTLGNIGQPLPFNPELGPQPQAPDFQMPLQTDMAQSPNAQPLFPTPPPGTPLKGTPLVGPNGSTPAADAAQAQPQAAPQPAIPPGDERYAGVTPQTGTTEPVGGNVAGFEKVYGQGEVPAGQTLTPEDAWDTAQARSQSGKAQPYGFVDRARSGAITPEEMGDLIYEHHRLVERAAGMEGTPQYGEAYQAALDFANNVLKPAETAWHQKGMTMQIARPVDLSNMTGMDTLMRQELNRGIKPGEASKFKGMANDIKNGESEVQKAVGRADAKVQRRYAKVPDIPIEEAVARVKQMLKDCM